MKPASSALACTVSEPTVYRVARVGNGVLATVSAALVAALAVGNLLAWRSSATRAADLAFAACAMALPVAAVVAARRPARGFVFAAAFAALVAFAFTGLGQGTSGYTFTTPSATRYTTVTAPVVLLLALVVVCTQLACWLARRHACACE